MDYHFTNFAFGLGHAPLQSADFTDLSIWLYFLEKVRNLLGSFYADVVVAPRRMSGLT